MHMTYNLRIYYIYILYTRPGRSVVTALRQRLKPPPPLPPAGRPAAPAAKAGRAGPGPAPSGSISYTAR
jgi:hypothetical protein